jgi:threonine aldolase
MRQVGVLAAAGIISLASMIERLEDDHTHARRLAEGLRGIEGVELDAGSPFTNMVYFNLDQSVALDSAEVTRRLLPRGVLVDPDAPRRFRLVTHYWIDDTSVDQAVVAFKEVLAR